MVRKEVFEQVQYNESLPAAIDYDLLLRAKDKGFKFANLNEVLCTYRIHDDSIGTKHRIKQLKGVYIANKLSKERSQFGREVTQLTADYFDRYQSLGEKYFLLLSNFQRENNIFVAGLRLVITPFSSVGRFFLLRKIKKIIQDRFF